MKNKAIFLDRDGTINVEKNYLYKKEEFEFINGSIEAIKLLNQHNYKVFVVTNQAGVARGYYATDDVELLHKWVNDALGKHGAKIDNFYCCPHHPHGVVKEYAIECSCRKPGTDLFKQAIKEFNIDINNSYMIGDKDIDMQAGKNVGLKTILVLTGYGKSENKLNATYIANDVFDAVSKIIV